MGPGFTGVGRAPFSYAPTIALNRQIRASCASQKAHPMRLLLALALFAFTACTDDMTAGPPPSCADVGCGSAALCNRKGDCTCPQPDGTSIGCVREPVGSGSGSGSGSANVSSLDDADAL